jgi:DNA-binding MarR family transcriptional regulator
VEEHARRQLSILTEIAQDGRVTQRGLAQRLDIALGLANLYLKRLARKGYIKITTIPPSRMRYLLTPKGIAEKTRLTYEYMDYSLYLYRQTREAIRKGVEPYVGNGHGRVAMYGTSEAAELAFLTLRELGLEVDLVVSEDGRRGSFLGIPLRAIDDITGADIDCVVVASFKPVGKAVRMLVERGVDRHKIVALRR